MTTNSSISNLPFKTGRKRLFLMRHGHVDYFDPALTDSTQAELTEEGRAQAAAAGEALSHIAFDRAVCSGYPRTRKTAELVLERNRAGATLDDDKAFVELGSGVFLTVSREELAARIAFCFDGADQEGATFLPEGETFAAAEARLTEGMRAFLTGGDWRTALVVAHEGANRILLSWACGAGLGSIGSFEQDLACINVIDFDVTPAPAESTPEPGALNGLQVERAVLKTVNVTPYDYVKHGLPKTSLEHLFDVDFGASRPTNA